MFSSTALKYELDLIREKTRNPHDSVVSEAKKILTNDLFAGKKVLQNLSLYRNSYTTIDEEDIPASEIFSLDEIKKVAILYRLKFLDHILFKSEIPLDGELKIKKLNTKFHKDIKEFKILAPHAGFLNAKSNEEALLFVKTNYDNYYLLHSWGKPLLTKRKFVFLPLRSFDWLVTTIFIVTLIITLCLPTRLITLDRTADYWSGYRAAAFFHLLIFNFGVTAYFTFAFSKNFSSSIWNRYADF